MMTRSSAFDPIFSHTTATTPAEQRVFRFDGWMPEPLVLPPAPAPASEPHRKR